MTSPKDAMPWVGLYITGASLVCTLAMAADAIQAIRNRKIWFPCRFFTINAASITLMAIAMKLPVDLTTEMDGGYNMQVRYFSIYFMVTMLANSLPSLGIMSVKELLMNIIALGLLLITLTVNTLIQSCTGVVSLTNMNMIYMIFTFILPFSVALTVPTSRRSLEHLYTELHEVDTTCPTVNFSFKNLEQNVKKHCMIAETSNPQLMIACSTACQALGVMCAHLAFNVLFLLVDMFKNAWFLSYGESDYKWSIPFIFVLQLFGILIGCIAPVFRCFTTIKYFNNSKKWHENLYVFKVEKHWTKMLQQWRHVHVHSHIPSGHHSKVVLHMFKTMILNLCIVLQITVMVICKAICLVPKAFLIIIAFGCYLWKSLLKMLKGENDEESATSNSVTSEMEEYSSYVVQIEEETVLSSMLLKNMLGFTNRLLHESEKKEPIHLVKLLEKSKGFNGLLEFDNDHVPPLHSEECQNSWSLVAVTLTAIAIALPNIAKHHVKEFIASMREGLEFIRHVEDNRNADVKALVKARKASRHVWTKVELYYKWLHIGLRNDTPNGKTSKEILQWLGDEAAKVAIRSMTCKTDSPDYLTDRFIAASSMYRISQSILLHFIVQDNWPNDEEVFEWVTSIAADVLCACFTNLPRVITMKCHNEAIEKRAGDIRAAARLLGKSKKILEILESRQLPDIDLDSMAYIDKWRVLLGNQMHDPDDSLVMIQPNTSHDNESMIVTIM